MKVLKERYMIALMEDLNAEKSVDFYNAPCFRVDEDGVITSKNLSMRLQYRLDFKNSDLENAISLYEGLPELDRTLATNPRLWTYIAHVDGWQYMQHRFPVNAIPNDKKSAYILRHWFLEKQGTTAIFNHGIASLWWSVRLTIDDNRQDKYELTKEWFSMQDYKKVMAGTQARSEDFLHAFLEYVIDNSDLFSKYKEAKVRYLMRATNRIGGYKIVPNLSKSDIKKILDKYKEALTAITS